MPELVTANEIVKEYGNYRALNKVSISISKGSIFGLLGPNGAGKTTLIRIINQIIFPDAGKITFNGENLGPRHIAQIGYLPEERGLYNKMKVGEQALYLARLKGMSKHDAKKKLLEWFERLQIGDWWNKKVRDLSKGMAQKIQFVVTVLHEPLLLIFDEPFSGFDPINAEIIKDEILKLREGGATVIFSTHRMESVEELCDHIALINKSEKILDGKLTDIKRKYKNNVFEVAIETDAKMAFRTDLQSRFSVSDADFKTIGDELKLNIKLPQDHNSKDLLGYLSNKARVTHFVEVIPTANDIFVKAVQDNEKKHALAQKH